MEGEIEDMYIDYNEVNACFQKGIASHGLEYVENIEKQFNGSLLIKTHETSRITQAFDIITNKIKTKSEKLHRYEVMKELTSFGFSTETLLQFGSIILTSTKQTKPTKPKTSLITLISQSSIASNTQPYNEYDKETFDNYSDDNDFEVDGDDDDDDTDEEINHRRNCLIHTQDEEDVTDLDEDHTAEMTPTKNISKFVKRTTPTFTDKEPLLPLINNKAIQSSQVAMSKQLSSVSKKGNAWIKKGKWR